MQYTDNVLCPMGHQFKVRRRATSAGRVVSTYCPKCRAQHNVTAGPATSEGPARLRESHIEARLVKRVKDLGGEVRKVNWIGRKGAPDRLVMLPHRAAFTAEDLARWFNVPVDVVLENPKGAGPGRAIWVELKAPGKAAKFPSNAHERAQHREHERMRKMGQRVEVVDSYEQIEEILK